jgi:hypothetical protein
MDGMVGGLAIGFVKSFNLIPGQFTCYATALVLS